MTAYYIDESVLEHRGVKGMKWGVTRMSRGIGKFLKASPKSAKELARRAERDKKFSTGKQLQKTERVAAKNNVSTKSAMAIRNNRREAGRKVVGRILAGEVAGLAVVALTGGSTGGRKLAAAIGAGTKLHAGKAIVDSHRANSRLRARVAKN